MPSSRFVVLLVASALTLVTVPTGSSAPPEPTPFIVGFHDLPSIEKGGVYKGASVVRVDQTLGFIVVETRDPSGFRGKALADPNVRYAKFDDPNAFVAHFTPNDPYYGDQYAWGRIGAPAAWDSTLGSTGVVVAVLDTGIDRAHEDFDSARVLQGYDFANGDNDPNDRCGHGTHVAGTVGATTNNGVGVSGTAQVSILPVQVLEKGGIFGGCSGSFSAVASGIRYSADQGADVISMSLGCSGCTDTAVSDALEYAWGKGSLIVASAGNSGPCTDCVGFPANHERAIAVACTDQSDAKCSFSSAGAEVEIAAPGKDVLSTTPGNGYKKYSGTSMSAPHVSGAAALAMSVNGALTNADVRGLLATTSKDLGTAGRDATFGYGLLDAAALVAAAGGGTVTPPANAAPTASFTYSCTDLSCTFDGTASADSDGTIQSYAWDFGDGATATGSTASHTYGADGMFAVTLTVTDDGGATDTDSQSVTVSAGGGSIDPSVMHVGDVTGWFDQFGRGFHRIHWTVPVLDGAGAGVGDAVVTVSVTSPSGSTATGSATTSTDGTVTFRFDDKAIEHGTFTLCVTHVAKSGWTYDAAANVETCQDVTVG